MKKYNLIPLKEQFGNDKIFFNEMLDVFITSTLDGVTQLEDALKNNDVNKMGHYAHKIVSPCRHIEAENLILLLKQIESEADKNALQPDRAKLLVTMIKKEATELITELKTERM